MVTHYTSIMDTNQRLVTEFVKRESQKKQLTDQVKQLQQTIQKAAGFRGNHFESLGIKTCLLLKKTHGPAGRFKSEFLQSCRQAIKANDLKELLNALKMGK
jgi:hypothetical protein